MTGRRWLAGVMLLTVVCADAGTVSAQTADDLFNDQAVQRIDLYVNTRDWYWLRTRFTANDYYPANMKWNGTTVTNVALRVRGAGSRLDAKPALRVDFNRYAAGRTFLGLTSIALNNGAQDPSGLRELLTMKTYRAMGLPAPRMAPVALYVNNAYLGLYNAIEEIDEAFVARAYGEDTGHLFEYRWSDYYHFEYLGSALEPYAALYEPKTRVTESMGALYLPIEAMIRTINDASDEAFAAAVSAYTNLPDFMRLVAVQAAIGEADGLLGNWGLSNHFLYRPNQSTLHRFIPWDASSSLRALDYPLHAGHEENVLMRRALKIPSLKTAYYTTLVETAALFDRTEGPSVPDQPAPGWLEREAARLRDLVRPAAYADRAKPYTNEEFEAGAEEVLAFARIRGAFVRWEAARRFAPGAGPIY
jgi:spore coat protein CotH